MIFIFYELFASWKSHCCESLEILTEGFQVFLRIFRIHIDHLLNLDLLSLKLFLFDIKLDFEFLREAVQLQELLKIVNFNQAL